MKKQLIIAEDDREYAEELFLDLQKIQKAKQQNKREVTFLMDECRIGSSLADIEELLSTNGFIRTFIIDLELESEGEKTIEEGLKTIESIREKNPDSAIIVHSGHTNYEKEALNRGANQFIEKGKNYRYVLNEINELLEAYWARTEILSWNLTDSIPSIIKSRDEEYVYVECLLDSENKILDERAFPKVLFAELEEVKLNKIIEIQKFEKKGAIKYQISETDEYNLENFYTFEDIDSSELYGSTIFDPE